MKEEGNEVSEKAKSGEKENISNHLSGQRIPIGPLEILLRIEK